LSYGNCGRNSQKHSRSFRKDDRFGYSFALDDLAPVTQTLPIATAAFSIVKWIAHVVSDMKNERVLFEISKNFGRMGLVNVVEGVKQWNSAVCKLFGVDHFQGFFSANRFQKAFLIFSQCKIKVLKKQARQNEGWTLFNLFSLCCRINCCKVAIIHGTTACTFGQPAAMPNDPLLGYGIITTKHSPANG
jgi:hypothetical protein